MMDEPPDVSTVKALVDRGFARMAEGAFEDSIGYFDEAIRSQSANARAFLGRGLSWHHLGEADHALADYDAAIRLDPKLTRAFLNRGNLRLARGETDEAIADYDAAVRLDPDSAHGYRCRGSAWVEQEEHARAVADFEQAIRCDPGDARAYLRRAMAHKALGDQDAALRDLDQAIRLDPRMSEALRSRSSLWQERGERERAQEDFRRAGEIDVNTRTHSLKKRKKVLIAPLLREHFQPEPVDALSITERKFPFRVRADLQRAIDRLFTEKTMVLHFGGVVQRYRHEGLDFSGILADGGHDPAVSAPPEHEEVDIGDEQPIRCLKVGLWLLAEGPLRFAVLLAPAARHGSITGLKFQVAALNNEDGIRITQEFFKHLEDSVLRSESYRGKILSLEARDEYSGVATGIKVHRLRPVSRAEVILPRKTLDLLDRNVIAFCRERRRLARFGLSTKKGLLFYGPPGTGKTHTIHYLAGALQGHTTFLISAEQIGLLGEYMVLARLLQPSMVVIEDVDLIARDRQMMGSCEEVLLNKLLNEMDGLKPDADVLFILTTNRPESLERALASRPGRVDQAIEFPLPDTEGRQKLIRLYSCGLSVAEAVIQDTVKRTEDVSASFIKELMRRSAQFHLEAGDDSPDIRQEDVNAALEELLFTGGSLNRKLLGATAREGPEE
jgi:tetratricopeptide (TPR) repeat protein